MYKVKLFSGTDAASLQTEANHWLQLNKDIIIHNSHIASSNGESLGSNEYLLYILYSSARGENEMLQEMAASVTAEQSLELKEMQPDILKPVN